MPIPWELGLNTLKSLVGGNLSWISLVSSASRMEHWVNSVLPWGPYVTWLVYVFCCVFVMTDNWLYCFYNPVLVVLSWSQNIYQLIFNFMHMGILPECRLCVPYACLVPTETKRGCWSPELELQAIVSHILGLGIKPRSSTRVISAHRYWAVALVPKLFWGKLFNMGQEEWLSS